MNTTFFTPSYINDLDRAIWMRRSINRFSKDACRHIIAVPRSDVTAFQEALRGDKHVEIVCQEDAVSKIFYPDWVYRAIRRLAKSQLWRFESHAGRAGWIVQQIVKLNCIHWVPNGAVVFIDSDLIFTRPFSIQDLGIEETTRTLVRITPKDEASRHRAHINNARNILSLPDGPSDHKYMAFPAIWYTDWIEQLHRYLEETRKTDWQSALHIAKHISEYTIYGTFVEEVLRPEKLAVRTKPFHKIIFDRASFDELKSSPKDFNNPANNYLALVVQSNLGISVSEYENILSAIIDPQSTSDLH
jgi:hypothetical protein